MRSGSSTTTPGAAKFQVSSALRAKMFALAQQLNHFQGQVLGCTRKNRHLGDKKPFAGSRARKRTR